MTWSRRELDDYISGGDENVRSGDMVELSLNGEMHKYLIKITDPYDRIHGTELYREYAYSR